MPFLSGEVEAEASSRGRGGRMAFGGFGVKEDDEDGDEDEDEDGKAAQVGLAPEENHDKGEIQRRQPENVGLFSLSFDELMDTAHGQETRPWSPAGSSPFPLSRSSCPSARSEDVPASSRLLTTTQIRTLTCS
jgi:hypothetical protein